MVVTHRNDAGKATVWCDPCLAPLIRALNRGGLRTVASCCGHGHRPGRISLADGRELFLVANYKAATELDRFYPTDINGDTIATEDCGGCGRPLTPRPLAPVVDDSTAEAAMSRLTEAQIAERAAWQNELEVIEMPQAEVDALLDYSFTLPTGKTIGKRWKRRLFGGPKSGAWVLCEYVEDPDPAYVGIRNRLIRVVEGDPR